MKNNSISVVLLNSPVPHFLKPETVTVSEDGKNLTGKVHFPTSRDSVGSRSIGKENPHVNLGDSIFACWNGAHVMAATFFKGQEKELLAGPTNWDPRKIIPPNTDIDMVCSTELNPSGKSGMFKAEFSLN